jgi:hypothetical protein
MTRGTQTRLALVAALVLVCGSVLAGELASGSSSAASTVPSAAAVETAVSGLIPDSSAKLVAESSQVPSTGLELEVALGSPPSAAEVKDPFAYAALGWRLRLAAASLASETEELRAFRLTAPGVSAADVPPAALGEVEGTLPSQRLLAARDSLGSLSQSNAEAQLESNLAVLRRAVPDALLQGVATKAIQVDPNHVAFEVTLQTDDASSLARYLGDVFVGLQTGLVGGTGGADGLAIVVEETGEAVAGSWFAARAMSGTQMFAPDLKVPDELATTARFPVLGGGSAPTRSAHADAIGSLPSLPTSRRIHFEGDAGSAYSAPGFVETPEQGSSVADRYRPHVRPRVRLRAGEKVSVGFTAPAHGVYVAVQRPNRSGNAGVAIGRVRPKQTDENGLRWQFEVPSSPALDGATTIFVKCRYPGGIGWYRVGVQPIGSRP